MSSDNCYCKCGNYISPYNNAWFHNRNKPAEEHVCDVCLEKNSPTFTCYFCGKQIEYGTSDFRTSLNQYEKCKDSTKAIYHHEICKIKHNNPPIKCDFCGKYTKYGDFWYPMISEIPEIKGKCQDCCAKEYFPEDQRLCHKCECNLHHVYLE